MPVKLSVTPRREGWLPLVQNTKKWGHEAPELLGEVKYTLGGTQEACFSTGLLFSYCTRSRQKAAGKVCKCVNVPHSIYSPFFNSVDWCHIFRFKCAYIHEPEKKLASLRLGLLQLSKRKQNVLKLSRKLRGLSMYKKLMLLRIASQLQPEIKMCTFFVKSLFIREQLGIFLSGYIKAESRVCISIFYQTLLMRAEFQV